MQTLLWTVSLTALAAADPAVKIEPVASPRQVRVLAVLPDALVKGLPAGALTQEQGEARLAFALVDADSGKAGPAILGKYERTDNRLVFTPRHALLAGERYRATLFLVAAKTLTADHVVPAKTATTPTRIEKVYPTADVLPANQLKFYIYFSRPMRESKTIFDHFELLDDKGKPVADPWRRTELWSADGKRLTLWIHPGRIKTGVNLREELGPVLEPNRSYTLTIAARLLDADGEPLEKAFKKTFRTTKTERSYVAVDDWKVTPPKEGTRDALTLTFPRPLDHALLQRMVQVTDRDKKAVPGRLQLGREERSLTFVPDATWRAGAYRIVADAGLEDLAGNTAEQLFDVDTEAPQVTPPARTLLFRPVK